MRPKLLCCLSLAVVTLAACTDSPGVRSVGSKNSGSPADTTALDDDGPVTETPDTGVAPTAGLDWGTCTDENATDPDLECATLTVPLDYSDPDGDSIGIALVRAPALGDRSGAVLFNPGGPGGSGFDYIAGAGRFIATEMGITELDIIGFDPRGVDRSNGIRCLTDEELDRYAYLDDTPDTPEEEALIDEAEAAFPMACREKYGDTLQHYSTANTARDMDAIRAALGDDTISFLGVSYGTYLGAVYATMFPERVRALALDSAFEPTGDTIEQQYETQLVGFEGAFDEWAAWCETNEDCAFMSADVGAAWDDLHEQLDESPITNDDGRIGNQSVMMSATIAALYSQSEWPVLGAALADAAAGDAAGIFRLADAYSGRDPDGHHTTIGQSNEVIACASGLASDVPPDPAAYAEHLATVAPRFGSNYDAESFGEMESCAELMPPQPADTLSYSGSAPIVVIGGANDPATPVRWAHELTDSLGPSARLVIYNGEGHGQLLASSCVTEIEAEVLVDLELPDKGTTCEPDPELEEPEWWADIPHPDGIDDVLDSPALTGALGIPPTEVYAEVRTSSLSSADVLEAYRPGLEDAGFDFFTQLEPLEGAVQAAYSAPNGDLFSVFVLGEEAFESPDFESAAALVPDGKAVVILLYIPE